MRNSKKRTSHTGAPTKHSEYASEHHVALWGIWGRGVLLIGLGVLAGCGRGDDAGGAKEQKPATSEPVVLTMAMHASIMDDDDFNKLIADPVRKKFPNVTLERINSSKTSAEFYEEIVSAKQIPDIVSSFAPESLQFTQLGITYNIEELIKKHQFDLNRIQPEFLQATKTGAFVDDLVGLPIFNNSFGLVYNKTLFDRFGVPYPQDGLTWEEARGLAVRLARSDSGVDYYGLYPDNVFRGAYQLSLPFLDIERDKAAFQTQEWKELFELWSSLYKAQGITKSLPFAQLFNEGKIGMTTQPTTALNNVLKLKSFDWDVATYPVNPKAPGFGQRVASLALYITAASEHKDAAFQAIAYLLSDEAQTEMSRNLKMSVLKDNRVQAQFGQANAELQAKNVAAFTKLKMAELKPFKYNFKTNPATQINQEFNKVIYEGKDINTALRDADATMTNALKEITGN